MSKYMLSWSIKPCVCVEMIQAVLQAESLWLHLGIIKELAAMCHSVFQSGDVRYGFTTIPTYPRCVSEAWQLHCHFISSSVQAHLHRKLLLRCKLLMFIVWVVTDLMCFVCAVVR